MAFEEAVSYESVLHLIETFFGERVTIQSVDSSNQATTFVLYEALVFSADVDRRHGSFGVRLALTNQASVSSPLGRKTLLRTGESQIRDALQAIDDVCRLRLPDKYLEAFDAAISRSSTHERTLSPEERRHRDQLLRRVQPATPNVK